jgi:CheY-like chemotaxis protein
MLTWFPSSDHVGLLNLANKTILLAEDSLDLRVYISSILSKSFNVVQVPDGQAALDYALRHPPSLIVVRLVSYLSSYSLFNAHPPLQTDQMMPKMTGNELITALRANPSTALIPVIMLSAEAGSEARAEALEMGFDDYLVK